MINYQSKDIKHVVYCVQRVFHEGFDHIDNLEALEINLLKIQKINKNIK